jgi:hypothetical protein
VKPLVLSAALVALAGCQQLIDGFGKTDADRARERVEFVLATVKDHGGSASDQFQAGVCRWYNDKIFIKDIGELGVALEGFEDWQRRGDIFPRLESFSIERVQPEEEGSSVYLVLTKINGGYRWLRVPPAAAIDWATSEEG